MSEPGAGKGRGRGSGASGASDPGANGLAGPQAPDGAGASGGAGERGGPGASAAERPTRPARPEPLAGLDDEQIARASADCTLPLVITEAVARPRPGHDLAGVAERTGLPADEILHIWRSLGFAEPPPGERAFTDDDVEVLAEVGALIAAEIAPSDVVLQMSRVIGSSMARIASGLVDALGAGVEVDVPLDQRVAMDTAMVTELMPRVLVGAWRRHLHAAAQRRLALAETGGERAGVVGFADLVGFTALSQQVTESELAAIVDQFEELAFEVITAGGGRVVKMIGDEVMFTVESPAAAAEIALALAEGTREADELSDVRVGLAFGPLLERESDLYGPVVNLASRITAIAFPGSVVVDPAVRRHLGEAPGYLVRPMRARYLKDIGRVPLFVLRRAGGSQSRFHERRRALGAAVRARVEHR